MGQVENVDKDELVKRFFQLLSSPVVLDSMDTFFFHCKGMKHQEKRIEIYVAITCISPIQLCQILTFCHCCFRILFFKETELCTLIWILECDLRMSWLWLCTFFKMQWKVGLSEGGRGKSSRFYCRRTMKYA